MRFYLVILGSAISLYAIQPYVTNVYHAKVKPRLISWLSWAVCAGIAGAAALMDHELAAGIFSFVIAAECLAVVALGANEGDRKWDNVDIGSLSGAILALLGMFIIGSPLIALVVATITYCFTTVPSFQHLYHYPKSEKLQKFAIAALAELIVLGSIDYHGVSGYVFTIYLLLENLTMIGIILFGPQINDEILPSIGMREDTTPWQPLPTSYHNEKNGLAPLKVEDLTLKTPAQTVAPSPAQPMAARGPAVPPTATFTLNPAANKYGWNNSEVTINFGCTTSSTEVKPEYITPPVKLSKEGPNQRITGTAIDSNNQTSRVVASVNIDLTPPQISNLTFSANPIVSGMSTHISIAGVDTLSGVLTGEYFVGKNDPGQGKGHPMTLQGNILSTFLKYDWAPGTYPMSFRAQDLAGNWSQLLSGNLVIQATQASAPAPTQPPQPVAAG